MRMHATCTQQIVALNDGMATTGTGVPQEFAKSARRKTKIRAGVLERCRQ